MLLFYISAIYQTYRGPDFSSMTRAQYDSLVADLHRGRNRNVRDKQRIESRMDDIRANAMHWNYNPAAELRGYQNHHAFLTAEYMDFTMAISTAVLTRLLYHGV